MAQEAYKKGEMAVVKLIFMWMLILLSQLTSAQKLDGSFERVFPGGLFYNKVTFSNGYQFKSVSSIVDNSIATVSKGYYLTNSDSIFFFHDSIPPPIPPSRFEIHEQQPMKNQNVMSVKLTILDHDGDSLGAGVTVVVMNGENLLFGGLTKKNSSYRFYTEGGLAEEVNISFVGYQNLKIDLTPFWGHVTKIVAYLQDTIQFYEYNQKYRIEKYAIKSLKRNRITLTDNNGNEVVWVREDEKKK